MRRVMLRLGANIFWLIFATNKTIAKANIGFIYPLDMSILLYALSLNPIKLMYWFLRLWPLTLLIIEGSAWLIHDLVSTGPLDASASILRRFAMSAYMLLPILFFSGNLQVINLVQKRYRLFLTIVLLMYLAWRSDWLVFSPSYAAFLAGVFLVYHLAGGSRDNMPLPAYLGSAVFSALLFFLLIKDPRGGFFRSPILSLSVGLLVLILHSARRIFLSVHKRTIYTTIVLFMGLLFVMFGMYLTPSRKNALSEALCSISSLTRIYAGNVESCSFRRARGDPIGTIETRVAFWSSIISYNFGDPVRFLIGSGHRYGFLEVVPSNEAIEPMRARRDAALIEPHNSYIGLVYRYGLVGLALFLLALFKTSSNCSSYGKHGNSSPLFAVRAMILVYAFTEVVLEVPYGALTFWIVWLLPCNPSLVGHRKWHKRSSVNLATSVKVSEKPWLQH